MANKPSKQELLIPESWIDQWKMTMVGHWNKFYSKLNSFKNWFKYFEIKFEI